jgi:hypothetical protein
MTTPDYERAATAALETLLFCGIKSAPVDPLPMLKNKELLKGKGNVILRSFSEVSEESGIDRKDLVSMFGIVNQDAATTLMIEDGVKNFIITYNAQLPFLLLQRAFARELGHIILCHDASVPDRVRYNEAKCFAHHLLCPRPLIRIVQDAGIPFTVDLLSNMTGCNDHCLMCMKSFPGVHVPAELNRKVRSMFEDYAENFLRFQLILSTKDTSRFCIFGTYMEGYEE